MGILKWLMGKRTGSGADKHVGQSTSQDPTYLCERLTLLQGVQLLKAGRHEEALSIFSRCADEKPDDIMAWNLKGLTLKEMGQEGSAKDCFEKALSIDNNDLPTIGNMYKCLLALGEYQKGIYYVDRYLSGKPDDLDALNEKGRCLAELGRAQEALECFGKAVAVAPSDHYSWINKGAALGDLGRHSEAITCYKRALELQPHQAVIWYNKANAEEELGLTAAAVESLERFLALADSPLNSQIGNARQRLMRLKSNKAEGIEDWVLENCEGLKDAAFPSILHTAKTYLNMFQLLSPDTLEALAKQTQQLLMTEPDHAGAMVLLGYALLAMRRLDQVESVLLRGRESKCEVTSAISSYFLCFVPFCKKNLGVEDKGKALVAAVLSNPRILLEGGKEFHSDFKGMELGGYCIVIAVNDRERLVCPVRGHENRFNTSK